MSWQNTALQLLRTIINDLSEEPDYEDDILEMTLRTAASYVKQEVNLTTDYTINLTCGDITPDPSTDDIFINFIVLKAACIVNSWRFQTKALTEGIRARCGPAELQVTAGRSVLMAFLQEGPCKAYEKLKDEYNFGNVNQVKAILTPFVSNNYLPNGNYQDRR